MKSFFLTAIILLLNVTSHSLQAQDCNAPAAAYVNWSGCDKGLLYLPGVDLSFANLSGTEFSGIRLMGANLNSANLTNASLTGADLYFANLTNANLTNANLDYLDLTDANLTNANLTSAKFRYATLINANLTGANLTGANLNLANLSGATLTGVVSGGITGTPTALPAGWALVNGYLVSQPIVTFDANGGTTSIPATKSVTSNTAYGTLATTSRSCYTFKGWFTASSGGTEITSSSIVAINSDQTLYAQWTAKNQPTASITGNTSFCAGANTFLTANATSGGRTVTQAGSAYSLFLKNDGTVWASGDNGYGQLGDGTITQTNSPVQVSGLSGITDITVGFYYSMFLKNDGTVWATGSNGYGQLGDGTTIDRTTPVQVSGLSGITAIAAGTYNSLFLKNDGTVWATGYNGYGQLGNGTITQTNSPIQVNGLNGIIAIAAGDSHSLFLKNDGTVWVTGNNVDGQLGDGTNDNRNTPVQLSSLSGITAVSAGDSHSLFLKDDGTVWATGYNLFGALGDGTTVSKSTPLQVTGLSGITAISAGGNSSLFLKNDGTVWATGNNFFGQLGDGTTIRRMTPIQMSGLSGINAIESGGRHSLLSKNDGTVWATGNNFWGQLGDGTNVNKSTPVPASLFDLTITSYQWKLNGSDIAGASNATYLPSSGGSYSLVVTNSNGCSVTSESVVVTVNQPSMVIETISACGSYEWHDTTYTTSNNTATWVGTNAAGCDSIVTLNLTIKSSPTAIINGNTTFCAGGNSVLTANATSGGIGSVIATAAGAGHSLFLKNDGTVWATGYNNYGQLGDGTYESKNTPVQLSGLNGITAMAGGALHSLFLQNDGTVWATGNNNYGQLGDGTYELKNTPVQVSGLSGISAIIAGDFHSLFLKNDGSVWAVGANQIGQFGDGTYVSTNIPVQVSGLSGITAMAGGSVHSLFLKNDGTVWATGYNGEGQLGDGTYVSKNTPVQVSGLSGITAITVRASHSLFLKSDGTVWATGYNEFGQLGDGTYENKNTPVQVSGLSGITAMAGGSVHSLFLKNDGTVWATGFSNFGQLGDGTYELKNTPVQVSGLSGTTAIAAGYNHSLFLKNDGTVRATGRNNVGQLGDGTYESKNTPVPVSGFDVTITSYQWKLNGSDIVGASNATYIPSTGGSYSLVVTNSNGCSVTSESVTIAENQPSTAPTSITSSVPFATVGVNFMLSVNGGSLGTGASWKWYTGSCGGTLIGTGASISVSQSANTTYYVRAEGTCNTTECATILVKSFCGASGITSSAGTAAVCAGTQVTLTVVGSLSPGASWRWDDECENDDDSEDDDSYSNTTTFTVSPNSTKTYYVRSVGGTCGLTDCVPITVNVIPKPFTPASISGNASVCPSTTVTYTIAAVAGATSYTWTAPSNATLVSAQGGTSMTVSYASTFTSGTLKVKASNCSGAGSDKTLSIVKLAKPATPASISGASAPCKGSTQTYSIAAVANTTSYTWTLPSGITFVSGTSQTGTSIQVVISNSFSIGTLSVKANNCGGSSPVRTLALTGGGAPTAPGTISGPSSVTQNTTNNTFSVTNVTGMTYNWTVPAGCTITLGQGTSTIKVTWGTVAGNVSVTRTNACGTSVSSNKAVSVTRSEEAEADADMESARTDEEVEILVTAADELSAIAVYPNPTTGEARITFTAAVAGKYALRIVDLQGRTIDNTNGAAIEGNNTIDIQLSNCSNGVYMIHLMHNDTLQTLRVVKM